jgi:5-methyltetrahydrofolate--homocysteine methyltransferase
MSIPGLEVIGDRINPGFKSTKAFFDNDDMEGIQGIAIKQAEAGANYLDVNCGRRAKDDPDFLVAVIRAIQDAVDIPLCFDFPNFDVQEICLKAYDSDKAGGAKPMVNSIAETRWDMLELAKIRPFKVILMASERQEDGVGKPNKYSEEVFAVAERMTAKVLDGTYDFTPDDIYIDTSISTLAADTEGLTKMSLDGMKLIKADSRFSGVHLTGAITNIGQQMPAKTKDGGDLRLQLENAFLTIAVGRGFDTVMGTPWRDYALLGGDNKVLLGLKQIIELKGMEAIRGVRGLYSN